MEDEKKRDAGTVRKKVRYSLGRVHAAADMWSFERDPSGCLERSRAFGGGVVWTSAPPRNVVPSEEAADRAVAELRRRFGSLVVEEGMRPLGAVHGMAWYERFVVLELSEEEKALARAVVGEAVGADAEDVGRFLEDLSPERLGRL